jgi:CII-binding regulator of phage lambda lysogenization HflD
MIQEEIQRLEMLAGKVAGKLHDLEQDNHALKEELFVLKNKLEEKEQMLEDFKNQIKIAKLVNSLPVEDLESAELREKINNYIKEIDNIIAYLSE